MSNERRVAKLEAVQGIGQRRVIFIGKDGTVRPGGPAELVGKPYDEVKPLLKPRDYVLLMQYRTRREDRPAPDAGVHYTGIDWEGV